MNEQGKIIQTVILGSVSLAGYLLYKLTKIVTNQFKNAEEGGSK